MRITVLFNPVSGAGRAAIAGKEVAAALGQAGHEVCVAHTRPEPPSNWLNTALTGAHLLVIAGGDGAVRMISAAASLADVPIYHLPAGTENLFAREFAMDRDPKTLIHAIEQFDIEEVDLGFANGEAFTLMASVGFDAEVVHELAACRGASISHFSYLPPIWRQLRKWRPCALSVMVDGQSIDAGQPGIVVVANSRQYGWRLNPAAKASMTDGQFDVAYFPCRSRLALIRWAAKCRTGRQFGDARLIYRRGTNVTIRSDVPCRFQLDGDPAGDSRAAQPLTLDLKIKPKALKVLVPTRR